MRKIKRFIRFLLIIVIVITGTVFYLGYNKAQNAMEKVPLTSAVDRIKSQKNYTSLSEISKTCRNAVIAVEDRRFYYHGGVDMIGIGRAVVNDIKQKKIVEGGSTITQQLAKNMYFLNDKSQLRKIAEVFVALKLEKEYSKDEILELYFNGIYYGSGYYNIYDATVGYFNKKPSEINDYEATLLAGIPNAPSAYSLDSNPELAYKRQEKVLRTMVECEYITEAQKDRILSDNN